VKLEAQGLSFLSSDYENTTQKNFGFFGASLTSDKLRHDPVIVDLSGLYAFGQPTLSYLNIREIYFNYQIDEISKLYFGRKINNWSLLEKQWNLNSFNPQLTWNSLNPETQGLTGLFWERKENFWKLSLFASPLFIPDQGPSFELKDGQFENSNPWFQTPPQNVRFQGNIILPVDYQLSKPETSDVVFQTLYGAQIQIGEKKGFFGQLSGMYKPANQLALGYKVVGVVTRVRVDLNPKVYTENDFAADIGYKEDWGVAQFSLLYSRPKSPVFDSVYNSPVFEDSLSFGPSVMFDLKPFKLGLAYLDTTGGDVKEKGPDASPDRAALSQRFLFRQAYQIELGYTEVFAQKIKIDSSFQYRQSDKDDFKQIHYKQKVDLKGPWAFWADLILIDTSDNTQSNLGPLRNLDQIFIGATYDI
jgi:hypothetical protein